MIYFFIYLFLEVVISVNIASYLGGIMTFFEIILSAAAGLLILLNFRSTLAENMRAVSYNCINLREFQELNLFTLFGAVLLILPGLLTDIVGVLMQFTVLTTMLVNRYSAKYGHCDMTKQQEGNENVIDVEIISDSTDKR